MEYSSLKIYIYININAPKFAITMPQFVGFYLMVGTAVKKCNPVIPIEVYVPLLPPAPVRN